MALTDLKPIRLNDAYGSLADLSAPKFNVRFTRKSGHQRALSGICLRVRSPSQSFEVLHAIDGGRNRVN